MHKHICFFIGDISKSAGTERITLSLSNHFTQIGYKVSIISLNQLDSPFFEIDQSIKLFKLFSKPKPYFLFTFQIIRKLFKITKREDFDIIINADVILSLFSLPIKLSKRDLKIISWEHFNYKTNLGVKRRDLARQVSLKYADAIVTLTEQDREFYIGNKSRKPIICAIPNFLPNLPEKYSNMENKTIIAVGRYSFQKGFDILINIWAELKKNIQVKDWSLIIVGDGEDKNKLEEKVKLLGLTSSIKFIPPQKKISEFYQSSSIYAMTSRYEGLPMVLLEALAYGLPIISFDCLTGPREVIENGVNGYLINEDSHDIYVEKLLHLMSNIDERIKMQKHSIIFSKRYTLENISNLWQDLFNSLEIYD